ncbi:hypothetical protein BaRGS_00018832 [Batillaria attramentaria]|uniref:NAD(P)H-hydrate epimerase n=1 Tax=Batillaria attramentaria TaxID=370345 RepID=A0ABD0KS89_9CAEN
MRVVAHTASVSAMTDFVNTSPGEPSVICGCSINGLASLLAWWPLAETISGLCPSQVHINGRLTFTITPRDRDKETCYPPETLPKDHAAVLVCCGPGYNGGDGLVCARHLKLFGYKPSIFYPKLSNKPLFQSLRAQCEQMDMPFLSFFPSEAHLIADSYNLVVDAIFGHNYKGPATPEFASILEKLKLIHTDVPVCSIDIPSGWDVDSGCEDGLQPELLISLLAPKKCATMFRGKYHFLGGRCVPRSLEQKYNFCLPPYPGTDTIVELKMVPPPGE